MATKKYIDFLDEFSTKQGWKNSNIRFCHLLFLLFLGLKLVGGIDWSWWWVTAPIWGTIVFRYIASLSAYKIYKFKEKYKNI